MKLTARKSESRHTLLGTKTECLLVSASAPGAGPGREPAHAGNHKQTETDPETMTREEAKRKIEADRRRFRRQIASTIRAMRAGRHSDGAVLLQQRSNPKAVVFVSPKIGGGWRATRFFRQEPVGHYEFERFRDAVASLAGKFGSWGPPHGAWDIWNVLGESDRF